MIPKIEVGKEPLVVRSFAKEGKVYEFRNQVIWMHKGETHPTRHLISVEQGDPGYPPGWYLIHPSSYETGKFGEIVIKNLVLVPDPEMHRSNEPAKAVSK